MVVQRIQDVAVDGEQLASSMAHAFLDDKGFAYVLPNRSERLRQLKWFFNQGLASGGGGFGEIYASSTGGGVSIWSEAGSELALRDALRAGLWQVPFRIGPAPSLRFWKLGRDLSAVHARLAAPNAWYLMMIGVSPEQQGQGLGGALMRPMLERADAEGRPCYLETFSEANLDIYRRYGFDVVGSGAISGGPPFWAMTRPAHTAADEPATQTNKQLGATGAGGELR